MLDGRMLAFAFPPGADHAAVATAVCAAAGLGTDPCQGAVREQIVTRTEDLGLALSHDLGLPLPIEFQQDDSWIPTDHTSLSRSSALGELRDSCEGDAPGGQLFFDAVRAERSPRAQLWPIGPSGLAD